MKKNKKLEIYKDPIDYASKILNITLNTLQEDLLYDLYTRDEIWNGAIVTAGIRGTKTTAGAIIASYALYQYLQIKDPFCKYNDLTINGIFVSNGNNSFMFDAFINLIESSKWWENKIEELKSENLFSKTKDSITLGNVKITTSKKMPKIVGKTCLFFIMDEVSKIDIYDIKFDTPYNILYMNVERTLKALYPLSKSVFFTTPITKNDIGMKLLYASEKAKVTIKNLGLIEYLRNAYASQDRIKGLLGYNITTWDANSVLKKEDYIKNYKLNPVAYYRDYEAIPPLLFD